MRYYCVATRGLNSRRLVRWWSGGGPGMVRGWSDKSRMNGGAEAVRQRGPCGKKDTLFVVLYRWFSISCVKTLFFWHWYRKNVYICTRKRRELSCDAKKAFVLVHSLKFAKFYTRTTILMPFASVYVLVSCHCISEHRIRFNVGFTCGRRLAMP